MTIVEFEAVNKAHGIDYYKIECNKVKVETDGGISNEDGDWFNEYTNVIGMQLISGDYTYHLDIPMECGVDEVFEDVGGETGFWFKLRDHIVLGICNVKITNKKHSFLDRFAGNYGFKLDR